MSSEKQLASRIRDIMQELEWDPVRVENGVDIGTPDVNTIFGWFEYKYVKEWPKRGGPLRIPHFTPQQRVWLRRRWRADEGYGAWMVLQVSRDIIVFDGETAAQVVGHATMDELFMYSIGLWQGRFPTPDEFRGVVLV